MTGAVGAMSGGRHRRRAGRHGHQAPGGRGQRAPAAPPRPSGPGRARPAQPQADTAHAGPAIPADIEARQLAPDVRRDLSTLDKATADAVARHLVAAGGLLDEDPEAALSHARAARARASRIA